MGDIVRPDKPGIRKARPTRPEKTFHTAIKATVPSWSAADFALSLYRTNRADLVKLVKDGVPAHFVEVLTERMAMPKDKFYKTMGLVRPTVDRKVRAQTTLNQDESERMIGIARLVGQAQSMVQESGVSQDFDGAKWVSAWLDRPLPALGGKRPGDFMDTAIGRSMVADILGQQQSSAYG
jgi:putative toxin-antitoxin system antitoxin component (TIGR02293 family)